MKTLRNFRVSMVILTSVTFSLLAIAVTTGLPRRAMATADVSRAAERVLEPMLLTDTIVIDHHAVDADAIPQTWLDQARVMSTFFNHASIGNNILDGIADLETQNPTRYTISVQYSAGTNPGINHYQAGSNQYPFTKVDGFAANVKSDHDVAFMKFCVGDFEPWSTYEADDIWYAYRDMMIAEQAANPNVTFVWWTSPLTTQADGRGLDSFAEFNDYVRAYVAANGGILFDIADVESHDPSGNPISAGGYEAMYNGYSTDGAHLNTTGRQRVARAMWWLLARTAGWAGADDWISITAAPGVADVYPGQTAVYTLSLSASTGFTAPVTYTLQGAPVDANVSFVPNPVTPPGDSQLYVTTTASTVTGTWAMTVTGTSGAVSDAAYLTLNVYQATFDLDVQPDTRTVLPGNVAAYTVSVTPDEDPPGTNVFTAPVSLALQGAPPDTSISFDPNPVIPPGDSQLHITTTASTATGVYEMIVSGTAGAFTETADLTLIVASASPSFTLEASPTDCIAKPDQTVSYTVFVTGLPGFHQPVSLTVAGLPAGVGAVWSINPVTPDGSSTLALSVSSSPSFGEHPLQVIGRADAQVVTQDIELLIVYPFGVYLPTILK